MSRVAVVGLTILSAALLVPLPELAVPVAPPRTAEPTIRPQASLSPAMERLVALAIPLQADDGANPEVAAWRNHPEGSPPPQVLARITAWRAARTEILHAVANLRVDGAVDLDDGRIPTLADIRALVDGAMPRGLAKALGDICRTCADSLREAPDGRADLAAGDALLQGAQRGFLVSAVLDLNLRMILSKAQVDRATVRGFEPAVTDHPVGHQSPALVATAKAFRGEVNQYARPLLRFVLAAPAQEVHAWAQSSTKAPVPTIGIGERLSYAWVAVQEMRQAHQFADMLEAPAGTAFDSTPPGGAMAVIASMAFKASLSVEQQAVAARLLHELEQGEALAGTAGTAPGPAGSVVRWQLLEGRIRVDLDPRSPLPGYLTKPEGIRRQAATAATPGRSGFIGGGLARELPVQTQTLPRAVN